MSPSRLRHQRRIAAASAVLELEGLERNVLAVEAHGKIEPVPLAGGVHHLDGIELDVPELQPAEARHLLVEAAVAELAITSLERSVMDRSVAGDRLAAGVADKWRRHGG